MGAITLTRITDGTIGIHWEVCKGIMGVLGPDFEMLFPTPATLATAWAQDSWEQEGPPEELHKRLLLHHYLLR